MTRLFRGWNSVHAKLLRTILFAFSIGIAFVGILVAVVVNNILYTNMLDNLHVTAKMVADRSAAPLLFVDKASAADNLDVAKNLRFLEFLCLYDADGALFALHYTHAESGTCTSSATREVSGKVERLAGDYVRVTVPVVQDSDYIGHVVLQANLHAVRRTQWLFSSLLAATLCISLVVVYTVGARLVRRSLIPLNDLYRTSVIIADNPLAEARATKVSDDEVGRVIDVFNKMLDTLAEENRALIFSENMFRSLSENAPIGVFMKSEAGEFEYTNQRWEEITGLDVDSVGTYCSFIDGKDRKKYIDALVRAEQDSCAQVIEYKFVNPDRGQRVLMEYVSPVDDGAGGYRFIGSLLDVTELKVAQFELEKLAFYDPLTQLPNRRFFRDHLDLALARAHKEGKRLAVYMTDLDEFKKVNDTLGHDVGDELLKAIAARLQQALYEGDVVSRMGGDEFMILLENIEDPTRLDHASQRILDALKTSISADMRTIQVSGSVGIAIYPNDATNADLLLRYADMALYNAKDSGGSHACYYSADLDARIKQKVQMEQKLRAALAANALEVFIQPQYQAQSRNMCWGEALVRWRDEEEGFISPEIFIPLAEETGLIFDVGDFVLCHLLDLLSREAERFAALGIQGISVNLSAKQFFAPGFVDKVAEQFRHYNVAPNLIEFELTESIVMDRVDTAIAIMESLRALGCQLSIDDFGTGYSSLSYLKRFPLTNLKIDRSFIRDIPHDQNDVEISCAILAMAHSLGLSVVAEGVETEEQAELLAARGCEFLQGYWLDRPMPIADLLGRVRLQQKAELRK